MVDYLHPPEKMLGENIQTIDDKKFIVYSASEPDYDFIAHNVFGVIERENYRKENKMSVSDIRVLTEEEKETVENFFRNRKDYEFKKINFFTEDDIKSKYEDRINSIWDKENRDFRIK